MAATMASTVVVVGLGSSSLSLVSSSSSPRGTSTCLTSGGFLKSPVRVRNPLMQAARASGGKFTCFERDWLRTDLNVIGFGLIGWLAPSSVPAINGESLTGLFFQSIGAELSHFPTGPALTSPFCCSSEGWFVGLLFLPLSLSLSLSGNGKDWVEGGRSMEGMEEKVRGRGEWVWYTGCGAAIGGDTWQYVW